jgi:hypothetical protein
MTPTPDALRALVAELRALQSRWRDEAANSRALSGRQQRRGDNDAAMESLAAAQDAEAYADELNPIADRMESLIGAGGWRAVSESLPDLDVPVWLAHADTGDVFVGGRCDIGDGQWGWCNAYGSFHYDKRDGWQAHDMEFDDDYPVTHWMPLPTQPIPTPPGASDDR